jgi:hypothetical protein
VATALAASYLSEVGYLLDPGHVGVGVVILENLESVRVVGVPVEHRELDHGDPFYS